MADDQSEHVCTIFGRCECEQDIAQQKTAPQIINTQRPELRLDITTLPLELRIIIYDYAVAMEDDVVAIEHIDRIIFGRPTEKLPSILQVCAGARVDLLHTFLKLNEVFLHVFSARSRYIKDFESRYGLKDMDGGMLCVRHAVLRDHLMSRAEQLDSRFENLKRCKNVQTIEIGPICDWVLRDPACRHKIAEQLLQDRPQLEEIIIVGQGNHKCPGVERWMTEQAWKLVRDVRRKIRERNMSVTVKLRTETVEEQAFAETMKPWNLRLPGENGEASTFDVELMMTEMSNSLSANGFW